MKHITIKNNWFFAAGGKYGWAKTHDPKGVGIRLEILKNEPELEIEIGKGLYYLDCRLAIEFIRSFKSIEVHKGIKIGIVSKTVLRAISEPLKKVEKEVVENPDLQLKMF